MLSGVVKSMSEAGSHSDGCESPIFGFSSGVLEHEKKEEPESLGDADHNLKIDSEEINGCENVGPSNGKTGESIVMPPPQLRGFSTASGKIIPVSEKALQLAKKKMELMDGWVDSFEDDDSLSEKDKTSSETKSVQQFKGLLTASGNNIPVSQQSIEAAKKMNGFTNEKLQVNDSNKVSCVSTTFVFDNGNQSRLSTEESNEVEDLTRLLLEDISADKENQWDEVEEIKQEAQVQPVNPVIEAKKIIVPTFNVHKVQTSIKRPFTEPPYHYANSSNPAKHGRFTKKFVPPRRKDSK